MTVEGDSLNQWLVLSLERREYALPLKHVVEVLRMVAVTPMPETPAWIAGVLNLRGKGVVVMDLRCRLGLPTRTPGLNTQIVILDSRGELFGVIVDEVVDIISLPSGALKPADRLAGASPMFAALAHVGARMILVLDLQRLGNASTALETFGAAHAGN